MIRNMTPHTINVVGRGSFEPSGQVARVATQDESVGEWDSIPLVITTYGEVENLPDETEDTILIVSALVRAALPERRDLASPSGLVRDNDGNVIGCEALAVSHDY